MSLQGYNKVIQQELGNTTPWLIKYKLEQTQTTNCIYSKLNAFILKYVTRKTQSYTGNDTIFRKSPCTILTLHGKRHFGVQVVIQPQSYADYYMVGTAHSWISAQTFKSILMFFIKQLYLTKMFNRTVQQNTTLLQPPYLVLSLPSGTTVTTDKNHTVVWLQPDKNSRAHTRKPSDYLFSSHFISSNIESLLWKACFFEYDIKT